VSEPRPIGWPARVAIVAVLGMLLVAVTLGSRAVLGSPAGTGAAAPLRVPVEAVATPVALVVLAGLALLIAVLRPVRRRRRDPERPDWVYEPPPAAWYEKALPLLVLLLIGGVLGRLHGLCHPTRGPPGLLMRAAGVAAAVAVMTILAWLSTPIHPPTSPISAMVASRQRQAGSRRGKSPG
jgi:hypothetical protein